MEHSKNIYIYLFICLVKHNRNAFLQYFYLCDFYKQEDLGPISSVIVDGYLKGLSRSTRPPVRLMMSELRGLSSSRVFFTYTGLLLLPTHHTVILVIYAPMNYTAPCVMFLMRADTLRGQVGGGWALEIEIFLCPLIL